MMETKVVSPIDQDLDRLEAEMRRLKVEYDIYFNGGTAKPPIDTKGRVDTTIKRLYDVRGMTFGQRFRYNGLVARYNVMRELWRRQTQERETTGRPPTGEAHSAGRSYSVVVRCRDLNAEPEKVSELYDQLIAAKRRVGERVGSLSLKKFDTFIKSRADEIKRSLASDYIEFVVGVDNGHVKFAVRPAETNE